MAWTDTQHCITNTITTVSNDPWPYWVDSVNYTSGTADVTYDGNLCTGTTDTNTIWYSWVGDTPTGEYEVRVTSRDIVWQGWMEDRASREAVRKREIRERRKAEEIQAKARRLLFHVLSDDEQQEFRRYGSIRIRGENATYELGEGSDLITVLDKQTEQPSHQLCLHAPLHFPKDDRLAAAILALRFNEAETVRLGNIQPPLSLERRRRIIARREYRRAA